MTDIYQMTGAQRQAIIGKEIADIKLLMTRPGNRELSSDDMRLRANRLQEIATGLRIQGFEVKEAYANE